MIGVKKMKSIQIFIFLLILNVSSISKGAESTPELFNERNLINLLKIEPFQILRNEEYDFKGFLRINKLGKQRNLILLAGKYEKKTKEGHTTFVVILRKTDNGFLKEKIFNFYTEKIDNLKYQNGLVYVIFTGESDYFGWIEWKDNDYRFIFNPDSNL